MVVIDGEKIAYQSAQVYIGSLRNITPSDPVFERHVLYKDSRITALLR